MRRVSTVTVILPTHGGDQGIPLVLRDLAVAAFALDARGVRLDVLLLEDPAGDAGESASKAAAEYGLDLTRASAPPDVAGAYLAGFRKVVEQNEADLVVTLDASGRHDPMQIPHLIDELARTGADVVIGSRWAKGSGTPGLSFRRWLRGRLASMAFRVLTGAGTVQDATTSFRVARLEVVRNFTNSLEDGQGPLNGYTVQTSFVAFSIARGYLVVEGPIIYRFAQAGEDRVRPGEIADFAPHLLAQRGQARRVRTRRLSVEGRSFTSEHFGAAQDIERLGTATRFFDWVLDEFDPYLRGNVLEVGAGLGVITRRLVERYPDLTLVALEPADNVFGDLRSYAALTPQVTAEQTTLADYPLKPEERFDAVVYLNVLEHIDDDARELRLAADALRPGGALLVFGPAMERLYSELDYQAGHYRRYHIRRLRMLITAAGLEVVRARYFDVLGVLPYFVVYRVLGRREISGSSLWGYDRVLVPLSRTIQRAVPFPPMGKNVIAVAIKTVAGDSWSDPDGRA
jgi:SAM-dependent methyltransferase